MLKANAVFYIPFYYTFSVNRKGLEGIAYFLEFYFFSFFAFFIFKSYSISLMDVFSFFLMLVGFTSLYEIGYIDNNTRSIKNESKPTLRHNSEQIKFAQNNYRTIYLVRIILAVIVFSFLFFKQDFHWALWCSLLTLLVFLAYNNIRQGWLNRLNFMLLRFARYVSVLVFLGVNGIVISLLVSAINFINNLAWYPERTKFRLPRFFGTKIFDSVVYFIIGVVYLVIGNQYGYLFIYMFLIKFILFSYKYILVKVKGKGG